MSKRKKGLKQSKYSNDEPIPKKKTKRPKRQAIKSDLKRWDDVDWEKYSDE